jgi:hypothetical protein
LGLGGGEADQAKRREEGSFGGNNQIRFHVGLTNKVHDDSGERPGCRAVGRHGDPGLGH